MAEWKNKPGYFISLEGGEGSGKSSLIKGLEDYFSNQRGISNVLNTREPGGTAISLQIREVIMNMSNKDMAPKTEFFLFLAARAQLIEERIQPTLQQGGLVISDRYTDTTLAYQGYARGMDLETLSEMLDFATNGIVPDVTLLLNVDILEGLNRKRKGNQEWNRLDDESLEFHRKVRHGYEYLATREPQRFMVIDANKSSEKVLEEAINRLAKRMLGLGVLGLANI